MQRNRFYFGMLLFAVSAFLLGQAAPNGCISPVMIAPQGEGSGLDSDMVDGKHSWELLGGSGGCLHVIDAEDNDVGISVGDNAEVFVPSLELSFRFDFLTGELSALYPYLTSRLYESIDCTGDYFLYASSGGPNATFSFAEDLSTVFEFTAFGNRTIRSQSSFGACLETVPAELLVATSWETVTMPSPFPAPLRLEAR